MRASQVSKNPPQIATNPHISTKVINKNNKTSAPAPAPAHPQLLLQKALSVVGWAGREGALRYSNSWPSDYFP